MKILVCVKQVPDMETLPEIDLEQGWIREEDTTIFRMNLFDEFALEEAVRIKEVFPNVSVDAVSVGPGRVERTIERALAKGADNGVHILYERDGYCPPLTVAAFIAAYAGGKSYDLILTGVMAEDDMQCQVGPLLAASLSIPCATAVIEETLEPADRTVNVLCELEGGLCEQVKVSLPALLTIQSGINRPRYPSLSNMLRARSQKPVVIEASTLPAPPEKEAFLGISKPVKQTRAEILAGTLEDKAEKLIQILKQKALLQ